MITDLRMYYKADPTNSNFSKNCFVKSPIQKIQWANLFGTPCIMDCYGLLCNQFKTWHYIETVSMMKQRTNELVCTSRHTSAKNSEFNFKN